MLQTIKVRPVIKHRPRKQSFKPLIIAGVVTVCSLFVSGFCRAADLVTIEYQVKAGDTLASIAQQHLYDGRRLDEFREGIAELNWDKLHGREVQAGDVVQINVWR